MLGLLVLWFSNGQKPRRDEAGANFQNLVHTVASGRVADWQVEVWCWRSSCHSVYKRTGGTCRKGTLEKSVRLAPGRVYLSFRFCQTSVYRERGGKKVQGDKA